MKKAIFIALTVALILSLATVSMATVTLKGQQDIQYRFDNGPISTNPISKLYDPIGELNLNGKVSDSVSANVIIDYNANGLGLNSYSTTFSPKFGTFTFGNFGYTTNNLQLLDGAFLDLKSKVGVGAEVPIIAGINAKAGYFDNETTFANNVITAGLGYTTKNYGADVNLVKIMSDQGNIGYTVNAFVNPVKELQAYLHFGQDQNDKGNLTLGLSGTTPVIPLTANVEYNLDQNTDQSNSYGLKLSYQMHNGLTWSYKYINISNDNAINQVGLGVNF